MGVFIKCSCSQGKKLYEPHCHNGVELIYIQSGMVEYQIGKHSYLAKSGDMVCIHPLEGHKTKILEESKRYYLQITSFQLNRLLKDPCLKSLFLSRPEGYRHCFSLGDRTAQIEEVFSRLIKEYKTPEFFSEDYLASLFQQLVILCYRACPEQFQVGGEPFASAVYEAQQYLDQNFAQEISVKALADRFFLSPSYFSHSFRRWTGYSPKQYVMLNRISCGKELLLSTDLPVANISNRCGFGDVNYFIRCFRRETGCTPGEYRKKESRQNSNKT